MKKYILILLLAVCLLTPAYVNADNTTKSGEYTCESQSTFGDPTKPEFPAYYMQKAFVIMKYAGIVLCITLTTVDFAQCILKDDKDGFKPALTKGIKRLIFAIVLFFLPTIVNVIMSLVGFYGSATCGIG